MSERDNFLPDNETAYQKVWRTVYGDGPTREELNIFKHSEDQPIKQILVSKAITIAMHIQLFPYFIHIPRFYSKKAAQIKLNDLSYRELEKELIHRSRDYLRRI
jgi:hypothetical protein